MPRILKGDLNLELKKAGSMGLKEGRGGLSEHAAHSYEGNRIWNSASRAVKPRKNGGVTFSRQAAKSAKRNRKKGWGAG